MNGPLLPSCTYSRLVLTVVALLLLWQTFVRGPLPSAYAQDHQSAYRVETLSTGEHGQRPIVFMDRLNAAVGNDEIVAVVPFGEDNNSVHVILRKR